MIQIPKKVTSSMVALAIGVGIGTLAAIPFGAQALGDNHEKLTVKAPTEDKEVSADTRTTAETKVTTTTPSPARVAPVDEPTPTPTPTVSEVTEPNETDPAVGAPVATLQAAITIAAAEHPDVAVVEAKLKKLGAETVFKVTFEDGWRIYVSADDGELMIVKDGTGKAHDAKNRAKAAWMKTHDKWDPWGKSFQAWFTKLMASSDKFAELFNKWMEQQAALEAEASAEAAGHNAAAKTEAKMESTIQANR